MSVFQQMMRRLWHDRRGNFAMIMAILAPTLVLSAGYGVNVAQLSTARSNLLAALDSAVTSTARDISIGVIKPEDAEKMIEVFLRANGQRIFSEGDRVQLESVIIDRFRKTVMAEASVEVDAIFPFFGAANHNKITTESAAMYSDRKIEVAMMLDVTGSMAKSRNSDKIGDLKTAATIAVEELLSGNKHSADRIRVALIPYAEAVNVGALAASTVFYEVRSGPDLPPPLDDKYWKNPPRRADNCATERKMPDGSADFSDDAPTTSRWDTKGKEYKALVNRDDRLSSCPSASIVPLTTNEAALKTAINSFRANGYTGGSIATQWTYYMLSPNWRNVIADARLGEGPADPDPDKLSKIAILMTDGEYNTVFPEVSSRENVNSQEKRSATNARSLCTKMKQDGIEVFTIGFALPSKEGAAARKILEDCASPDTPLTKHFYDAATGDQLKKAFQDIVRNIERLALVR